MCVRQVLFYHLSYGPMFLCVSACAPVCPVHLLQTPWDSQKPGSPWLETEKLHAPATKFLPLSPKPGCSCTDCFMLMTPQGSWNQCPPPEPSALPFPQHHAQEILTQERLPRNEAFFPLPPLPFPGKYLQPAQGLCRRGWYRLVSLFSIIVLV